MREPARSEREEGYVKTTTELDSLLGTVEGRP